MRFAVPVLVLALAGSAPALAQTPYPDVELPMPTGSFPVGTRRYAFRDESRPDTITPDPDDRRELVVQVWYPAADSAGPPVPYMDPATAATWVERHGFPEGFQDRVRTHARADAPLARTEEPLPLLLFSHGLSWPALMYQSFFEELASHGYVIAAVNHTHYSDMVVFPDGRKVGFDAWGGPWESDSARDATLARHIGTWVDDLTFVLDEIQRRKERGDEIFSGVGTSRVGAFGHSYGGGAVARLLARDPRVVAAADMEGEAFDDDPDARFVVPGPFLLMYGAYNVRTFAATEFAPRDSPLYEVSIHGVFHSTFSDLIYLHVPKADAAWKERHRYDLDPARALAIMNDYLVTFFDRFLRGTEPHHADLLHLRSEADREFSSRVGYPEVDLRMDY